MRFAMQFAMRFPRCTKHQRQCGIFPCRNSLVRHRMRKICPLHHLPSSFVFVIFTLYFHTMARTTNILVVALVLGIATSVRAHTCLLDPLQRNGAPGALTKVADPACGLNAAPCGGTKVGSPSASYQAGTTASITWVKNLNHYNSAAPGWWRLALSFSLWGWGNV